MDPGQLGAERVSEASFVGECPPLKTEKLLLSPHNGNKVLTDVRSFFLEDSVPQ